METKIAQPLQLAMTPAAEYALTVICKFRGKPPSEIVRRLVFQEWKKMQTEIAIAQAMSEHRLSFDEAREFVGLRDGGE